MKTFLFSVLLASSSSAALAQQNGPTEMKTLLGPTNHLGFFAATSAHYSRVAKQDAYSVGGRLGLTFNRALAVGLGGTFVTNEQHLSRWWDAPPASTANQLAAAYGGVYLEPMLPAGGVVHLAFPVLLGAGAATNQDWNSGWNWRYDTDDFFVVEPGVTLEVNVLKFLVLGAGATYRHTTGLRLPDTANNALNGFTGGLTLKVGRF